MPVFKGTISNDNPSPDNQEESNKAEQQNAFALESDEQPIVREVTQTDRLNKNLLNAFLNRINNGDLEFQPDNEEEQNDEWN